MNELLFEPPTTPDQWCEVQPCFEIGGVTFTQPLGSILVYLLALLWIAGGVYLWRIRDGQRSREWMVLALVLGGIGAGLAGNAVWLSFVIAAIVSAFTGLSYCELNSMMPKEAAEYTGYSQGHIRYLLGKGEVEGRRFGRDWFTTKKALDAYLATNPRPGPRSEKNLI